VPNGTHLHVENTTQPLDTAELIPPAPNWQNQSLDPGQPLDPNLFPLDLNGLGAPGPGTLQRPCAGSAVMPEAVQQDYGQFRLRVQILSTIANLILSGAASFNPRTPVRPEAEAPGVTGQSLHHPAVDPTYIRTVSNGQVIYQHPTAGRSYGKGQTRWEIERNRNEELRGGNYWAMWNTQDEWESAKWMATTKVSQSSLDKLLKTKRVSN
jgi:hypothetical protein